MNKRIPINREQLLNIINNLDDPRTKAFISMLYVTGASIGQLVNHKRRGKKHKGIKKFHLDSYMTKYGKNIFKVKTIRNYNARKDKSRYRDIYVFWYIDKDFIQHILNYIRNKAREEVLFNFSTVYGWKLLDGLGINARMIKAIRDNDLKEIYGFSLKDMNTYGTINSHWGIEQPNFE